MKSILSICIYNKIYDTEELRKKTSDVFLPILKELKEKKIWNEKIKKLIITDDIYKEVEKLNKKLGLNEKLGDYGTQEVVSKTIYNKKENDYDVYNLINFKSIINEDVSAVHTAFQQVIEVTTELTFSNKFIKELDDTQPHLLDGRILTLIINWCKKYNTHRMLNSTLPPLSPYDNNKILNIFKRALKKILYNYNSDKYDENQNLINFSSNYFTILNNLFYELINNETNNSHLTINNDDYIKDLAYKIIDEIKLATDNILENKSFNLGNIKNNLLKFSSYYEIHLTDHPEGVFFKLTKDPKTYFSDLVDTEPRFVCFLDILGFSNFVNSDDENKEPLYLELIQESFTEVQQLISMGINNDELLDNIEYQTFSDNICISIPYFDNKHDYLSNLNMICAYVRGLQYLMMTKGIFMRGGLTSGSYYADKNIIFSKGLIQAYNLESKKAIYPRTLIDQTIIDKLLNYDHDSILAMSFDTSIIIDWEYLAFLNPFNLTETSRKQLQAVHNNLSFENEKIDNNLAKSINKYSMSQLESTDKLLDSVILEEYNELDKILKLINDNLSFYINDEKVYKKYLWIKEFIIWIKGENSSRLKFNYFGDFFKHE